MVRHLVSRHAGGAVRCTTAFILSLGLMGAGELAGAQTFVYAYSAACHSYSSDCFYGPSAVWTPPDGPGVTSSVSHGFSYIAAAGDGTSYNYSGIAAAQASVSGVNAWSASSSASGYFNSPGTYTGNGVNSAGVIVVRDEFRPASTPTWSGPGWFRLSYRITGDASVTYSESSDVSGQTLGLARSSISFECGSIRIGASGGSPCASPDFSAPPPGSINLSGSLNFDSSQSVDRIVSFDMPVYSDLAYAYRLQTGVSSAVSMNALNRTGLIQGNTAADFSHTFTLVDAKLFDAGFNEVTQWSASSASGFDYANISAVPEPGMATLLALGVGLLGWRFRRPAPLSLAA